MIVVSQLRKTFEDLRRGEVVALDSATFSCRPGEIFGLLGPNGAGKTTTMRILSTVLRPSSGTATVAGYDVVTQASLVRASIGFLSGSTALYDRMSAWEHVEYFGKLYGLSDEVLYERMERLFDVLQMNDYRDMLASKMSTGMKQKVSIARTIVHDPPVLIFDEPTSGLDVLVARTVLENIERLKDEGKCIIYSTHIMSEVEKLCERVAIIHHGRLLDQGPLGELRERFESANVEEIFFRLIEKADQEALVSAGS
ncbi:Daunorubicin/doxorubicin resistance ATP-binding protein DrrA [Planctomycetes bacterium Pan216]|uniref:Daunorubicin/doxorubicin resistance ATP-binding protein DrrA n=1 Tax=Kolteria novifilia TaxID=2527975 RepID=A0A518BAT2_9BACT|nr:Daunorubicin/doxorubicin resistance ATP-binding protein DrrA [Planctomycetes bacterium Pan216]